MCPRYKLLLVSRIVGSITTDLESRAPFNVVVKFNQHYTPSISETYVLAITVNEYYFRAYKTQTRSVNKCDGSAHSQRSLEYQRCRGYNVDCLVMLCDAHDDFEE